MRLKRAEARRSGLRKRWLRNTVAVVFAMGLMCAVLFVVLFGTATYGKMESELLHRAEAAASFLSSGMSQDPETYFGICLTYTENFTDKQQVDLQFVSPEGELLAVSSGTATVYAPVTDEIAEALETGTISRYRGADPRSGKKILAVTVPMLLPDGSVMGLLRYVTPTADVDRQILGIGLGAAGVLLLITATVYLITRRYIRAVFLPLEQIIEKAKMIAGGSYGIQIQLECSDEIQQLKDTINELSVQINRNEKLQSEFISSLSHELRTPLTAIAGWSETLLGSDDLDMSTRRGVKIIQRETNRLTEMVLELLDFTRIQDGRMTLNIELTDIRSEFEDTVYMYSSRLSQDDITLELHSSDEPMDEIPCDPERMRQVFLNILDNAAKHGGEGKRIDATICQEPDGIAVRIRDYGPGIPEDELSLVKKKFYKGSSKARGSGIGLAVSDEIVQMHGGDLILENAPGGGTLVTVWLPISQ